MALRCLYSCAGSVYWERMFLDDFLSPDVELIDAVAEGTYPHPVPVHYQVVHVHAFGQFE